MDAAVRALVGAGFEQSAVVAALECSRGDPDEATLLLLGDSLAPERVRRRVDGEPSSEIASDGHGAQIQQSDGGGPRGGGGQAAGGSGLDWSVALPEEVLEVLGKWLNDYLGAFEARPREASVPEYLHPLVRTNAGNHPHHNWIAQDMF